MKFFRKWPAKVGSLLLSVMLFFYVQSTRIIERDIQVRVIEPNLPRRLLFTSKLPAYLKVRLRGPREFMDFPVTEYKIELIHQNPRPSATPNLYTTRLVPELPVGVNADYERGVKLYVDRLQERTLPVAPLVKSDLPADYVAGLFRLSPSTIRIRGPKNTVSHMERIKTRLITVTMPENEDGVEGERNKFQTRVFLGDLPEYVTLARNQPLGVEYQQLLLPKVPVREENEEDFLLEEVEVRCSNNISNAGFALIDPAREESDVKKRKSQSLKELRMRIKVLVRRTGRGRKLESRNFSALVFCPLRFPEAGKLPAVVKEIPIQVKASLNQKSVRILDFNPKKVDLHFTEYRRGRVYRRGISDFTPPKKGEKK